MPVTTPAMGIPAVGGQQQWCRFVRRLATRPSSELSLVYVPDGTHDRLAVLKRLPPALATDPTAVEKFRVEARIAAMLEHPNIVRVFEIVETPREDFYTMEYVRGADMRQLMDALATQQRTLPLDCVLLIAIELCNALDYAHHLTDASGLPAPIIHRELSPSKVLLGADGTIKLTGFGTPPLHEAKPRRARTESVGYTSPERVLGETTDSRSDVFALGVLLYELSSGERLFSDATTEHQIMTKIVRGDMPRPSEVRRGYPRELEKILMRALARVRNERYQSASELQAELETFLWSRWPTASTTALAKLVATAFPSDEATDLATGSRELERIDPFAADAAPPSGDPVLWLGPVPLAKPYLRAGEVTTPRTDTKELRRLAPSKFPEASNVEVALGAPGPKTRPQDLKRTDDRAATVDELAIAVEHPAEARDAEIDLATSAVPRRNANVLPPSGPVRARPITAAQKTIVKKQPLLLGTPGKQPSPLATEPNTRTRAFAAASVQPQNDQHARGQYQRPEALDEHAPQDPDGLIIERLRAKKRAGSPRIDERASNANVAHTKPEDDGSNIELARSRDPADDISIARPDAKVTRARTDRNIVRPRSDANIARVELARVVTPVGLVRADLVRAEGGRSERPATPLPTPPVPDEAPRITSAVEAQAEFDLDQVSQLNWTLIPSAPPANPADVIRLRLPSPPPSAITAGRRWPLGTIAAIVAVVVVGVMASAWAIRRTVHEPSDLPDVMAAQPSPPTDIVLHTTQQAPAPAAVVDPKKPKHRPAPAPAVAKKPSEPAPRPIARELVRELPQADAALQAKKIPPLFPPPDTLPVAPGSLDGLPSIKTIEVKGTIADLAVRRGIEQALSPFRACYRAAARARQQTPQVELAIAFEIDRRRVPVKVRAIGGGALDTLATCAAKVTSDIRDLPAPSHGAASVSVLLEFRPNP